MQASGKQGRGFRLAQISDCHLPEKPQTSYRGLNADQGLAAVLAALVRWQPDGIILTGDLSEDASRASYQRLAAVTRELGVPVCALPGNHDEPALMQEFFPNGPYAGPHLQQAGDWQLLLLNSARPGRIDGCLDEADLQAISGLLAGDQPAVLALHHQPLPIGAPWIDRYMLEQPEKLLEQLRHWQQIKVVTWGHVHQVFESRVDGVRFLSAPSTAANSLPNTQRFTLDPDGPACRCFELFADGGVESGILYAQQAGNAEPA